MTDPLRDDGGDEALRRVYEAAGPYLSSLADRPVHDPDTVALLGELWQPAGDAPRPRCRRRPQNGYGQPAACLRPARRGGTA